VDWGRPCSLPMHPHPCLVPRPWPGPIVMGSLLSAPSAPAEIGATECVRARRRARGLHEVAPPLWLHLWPCSSQKCRDLLQRATRHWSVGSRSARYQAPFGGKTPIQHHPLVSMGVPGDGAADGRSLFPARHTRWSRLGTGASELLPIISQRWQMQMCAVQPSGIVDSASRRLGQGA
jgi:hypothetical protein